jgi:hypothetical protein
MKHEKVVGEWVFEIEIARVPSVWVVTKFRV